MENLRWQKQLLKEKLKVPKMAKETLALKVPKDLVDWLEAEHRNYERRVHMSL